MAGSPRCSLPWREIREPQRLADEPWIRQDPDGISVGWPHYADFTLRLGNDPALLVRSESISSEQSVLAAVLSVIPLALPLMELEALHASAVRGPHGVLLLIGHSGSGKSTLSRELVRDGSVFLCDDVCAFDDDARLWPGPPLSCAIGTTDLGPVVGRYAEKWAVRIPRPPVARPLDVSTLAFLSPQAGSDLRLVAVTPGECFALLLAHARSPSVFPELRQQRQLAVYAKLSTLPSVVARFDPAQHAPADVVAALSDRGGVRVGAVNS